MLQKKPTLIITFATTTQAMAVEAFCQARGLPGRLIPVPREITAGCGLSWKAKPEEEELLVSALNENGLAFAGTHIVTI